ncbi:hypothetical protein C1280_35200 [Gemmata obscuriglobus]|uniref:Uncharacterized protein n=1 Tax=Gemmata obscuriglobus TaxID=114 RepID=A0A2Z3HA29_9BACT|nr:hypothetical protein C1280_35200 [Gemmata obscuriglobus]
MAQEVYRRRPPGTPRTGHNAARAGTALARRRRAPGRAARPEGSAVPPRDGRGRRRRLARGAAADRCGARVRVRSRAGVVLDRVHAARLVVFGAAPGNAVGTIDGGEPGRLHDRR